MIQTAMVSGNMSCLSSLDRHSVGHLACSPSSRNNRKVSLIIEIVLTEARSVFRSHLGGRSNGSRKTANDGKTALLLLLITGREQEEYIGTAEY